MPPDVIKKIEQQETAARSDDLDPADRRDELVKDIRMALLSSPRTPLKAFEGSKDTNAGKRYALAIHTTVDSEKSADAEIRHVNECFVNWLRNRGSECADLTFAFTAPVEIHGHIRQLVGTLVMQPLGMDDVMSRLNVQLTLSDAVTGVGTEMKISWEPPAI